MKLALLLAAAVVLAQDAPPPPQEKPAEKPPEVKKAEPKACDLAKAELRDHCPKCRSFPQPKDLNKAMTCRSCGTKLEKSLGCWKAAYECKMHQGKRHAKPCCATPACCRELVVVGHVLWKCDKCAAVGNAEKEIPHAVEKCPGKAQKFCELSGKFPHGGEEK